MQPSASARLPSQGPFVLPQDRWFQVVPAGEFRHPSGFVEVIDAVTRYGLVDDFERRLRRGLISGLPVDFDHLSQPGIAIEKPDAAGMIVALKNRADGIWAQLRFTDVGERALRTGRYRFFSPEFDDCCGNGLPKGKIRPGRILGGGLTNRPVLDRMMPWSAWGAGEEEDGGNGQAAERFAEAVREYQLNNRCSFDIAWKTVSKQRQGLYLAAVS